ncbi:MAG: ABC transporter ATP-binding protein [Vulcanimicrobiota bacterium]
MWFSYRPGVPILQGLSVLVPQGKITALIGRNGCGKSTLLKLMNRLLEPDSGGVFVAGRDLRTFGTKELAQTMAHLTQSPTAPAGLTVKELVEFGRHPYRGFLGRATARDREVVEWALEQTALVELAEREVETLSGGQRQRAWIAMALAQDTEYLLLDEPTTYLDIAHQLEVLELLGQLNESSGKTIIMVVHDPNHASQYAHHVVCLAEGKLLREGTPAEIFTNAHVEELFGVIPQIFPGSSPEKPWCVPLRTR